MQTPLASRSPIAAASPAETYETKFVPVLFGPWAPVVCAVAGIAPGQRVLDVASGTGALAAAALERATPGGAVCGVDANPQMLAVARRLRPRIDWHDARAESLPFADSSFDRVVSQFGLMFFDDRVAALREMLRVRRPGGRVTVAVWDSLARSPGYAAFAELLARLFGRVVADRFAAPFALGDADALLDLFAAAGFADARVLRRELPVRFASVDALVAAERACAWTLGGLLDDEQFERLRGAAPEALGDHVDATGATAFALPALIVTESDGSMP